MSKWILSAVLVGVIATAAIAITTFGRGTKECVEQ
jgi:hypothetical protein